MPPLEQVWQLYLRRFTIDHWYRFLKQRLHWTVPKLSTPKQCERWSDLMPLMTWELWLARDIVTDNPLPWQKSLDKLTPGRVAIGVGWSFSLCWYSCCCTQTSRKVSRLDTREKPST